jgi:hypothetical protein
MVQRGFGTDSGVMDRQVREAFSSSANTCESQWERAGWRRPGSHRSARAKDLFLQEAAFSNQVEGEKTIS